MATLWFCDRCGKQVPKDSYGAGKYGIQKTFYEANPDTGTVSRIQRFLRFCDTCSREFEKFLDDEFANVPETMTGVFDRRC